MADPGTCSSTGPGGSGRKQKEHINEMLERLGIEDDEFDDLVF
jgi:hypothetical protein